MIIIIIMMRKIIFTEFRAAQTSSAPASRGKNSHTTANLPTNIVNFRRFDSSTILCVRGEMFMSIGDFPECLSQAMLVGIMSLGRLCVARPVFRSSTWRNGPSLWEM